MQYIKEKKIPFYYLYDDKGSEIYDEITRLEEYYPYKKEEELLQQYSPAIFDVKNGTDTDLITLVEFGAGYSIKTEIVLKTLLERYGNVLFIPIDVSEGACNYSLQKYSSEEYSKMGKLKVEPYCGTYDKYCEDKRDYNSAVIYLWLGSSIGNLEEHSQIEFLKKVNNLMTSKDTFAIGFDSIYKEDKTIIYNAYNDSKGVTARFILNILSHLKNKYNLVINENDFEYECIWNDEYERVEMYVKAKCDTVISNENESFLLKAGERFFIEHSHKFSKEKLENLGIASGLNLIKIWYSNDRYHMIGQYGAI
jgi:L-histidine N-alpha-methyltransferase